jgi:hypothetical protein
VNLVGTAMMPMFFLLSGFVLVLHDGQTLWSRQSSALSSGTEQHEDSALPTFNALRFYHKRAARILPVYYLTSALAVTTSLHALMASRARAVATRTRADDASPSQTPRRRASPTPRMTPSQAPRVSTRPPLSNPHRATDCLRQTRMARNRRALSSVASLRR